MQLAFSLFASGCGGVLHATLQQILGEEGVTCSLAITLPCEGIGINGEKIREFGDCTFAATRVAAGL